MDEVKARSCLPARAQANAQAGKPEAERNGKMDNWINGKESWKEGKKPCPLRHPESPCVMGEGEGGLFRISFYGKDGEKWIIG